MSLKVDRLQLEIIIDNDQARKQLRELEDEMKQLKKALKKVPEGSEEWKKIENRLKTAKQQHDKVIESIGIHGLSLKELAQRQRELNLMMRNMDPRTDEFKKLAKQSKEVSNRQAELRQGMKKTNLSIKSMADGFNKYFGIVTAGIASLTGLFFSMKQLIQGSAELSDKLADVRKTTGLTGKEVRQLAKSLKTIDTRSSRSELLDLSRIAGKLGVFGKENILGFVRAADKINVALSEDLGGNTEETIRQVGKLVDIFKVKEEFGLEQGLLKVGSAINSLGAASTANEAYMVEFSKRFGGIAPNADISIQDTLGLAATLDQLGQTTEVSTTALGKLTVAIGKDIPKFAGIANMSIDEFSKLLGEDANEALIKVLEGAKSNKKGLEGMAESLNKLGIDGSRAIGVIGVLSNNIDLLRQQQEFSNKEFEKGTSLTEEFNVKNENLAANLAKIRKTLAGMFINSTLMSGINTMVKGFANLIGATQSASDKLLEQRDNVNLLVVELTNANTQEERKKEIWDELQQIAPGVLENINKENISVSQLAENLRLYNEQMIKKIAIQDSEETLEDARNRAGEAAKERIESEIELSQLLIDVQRKISANDKNRANKIQEVLLSDINVLEKYKQIEEIVGKASMTTRSGLYTVKLSNYANALETYKKREKEAQDEVNKSLKAYMDMYKILMGEANENGKGFKIGDIDIDQELNEVLAEIDAEIAKYEKNKLSDSEKKALEKLLQEKLKIQEDYYNAINSLAEDAWQKQLPRDEQELLSIDEKYQALYEKADLAGQDTSELQTLHAEELAAKQKEIEERTQEELLQIKQHYGIDVTEELMNLELAALELHDEEKLLNEKEFQIARQNIIDKYNKKREAASDKSTKGEKKNIDKIKAWDQISSGEKLARIQSTISQSKAAFAEHTAAYKILASAEAAINTYNAANLALASFPPPYSFIAAGLTIAAGLANVAKINAWQFATGKYDVIGANDGRTYKAGYAPKAKTGIYSEPTLIGDLGLVGEKSPELVVDGPTLNNIRMNAPGIIEAIQYYRIPQYASGNYSQPEYNLRQPAEVGGGLPGSGSDPLSSEKTDLMINLLSQLVEQSKKPVPAEIVYSKFEEADDEMNEIKNNASK